MEFVDVSQSVPYILELVSDTNCAFVENPVITVVFAHKHTSVGIMLYFVSDYSDEIIITWYTMAGTKLMSDTFYPDCLAYYYQHQEDNYGKIIQTSQTIDLTGGYISQAKARGYGVVSMDNAYTGEIYTGEGGSYNGFTAVKSVLPKRGTQNYKKGNGKA